MKHLYHARDYFRSALQPSYSSFANESIGFISESFYGHARNFSGSNYGDLLLSVCTVRGSYLQLVFDADAGCTGHSCNCIKNDIARKFGLRPQQVSVHNASMDVPQFSALQVGDMIAHESLPTWGTLGGFAIDKNNNRLSHIVSNNHVLANSNNAKIGDDIYKKGTNPRHIAKLQNYIPIRFGGYANELDLAVAELDSDEQVAIGSYIGYHHPRQGEIVTKVGAKTGTTQGVVQADDRAFRLHYNGKLALFVDQLLITDVNGGNQFSQGGDSGSFIFGENGDFVGLLFAGGITGTSANRGVNVASKLQEWKLLR